MRKLGTLLIFLNVVLCQVRAQFVPGYLVIKGQDTLRGMVAHTPMEIQSDLWFKDNADAKARKFPLGTVVAYGAYKMHYHLMNDYGENLFMQLIVDGYLRLYESVVLKAGGLQGYQLNSYRRVRTNYLLRSGDSTLFDADKGKFKEQLSIYFKDDRIISEKIRSGEYKKKDLSKIVAEYNKGRPFTPIQ